MNDIALTQPADNRVAYSRRSGMKLRFATLRSALTYLAFASSVAFTFAFVVGVIN